MSFLKWLLSEQFYNNDKRKKGDFIIGDLAEDFRQDTNRPKDSSSILTVKKYLLKLNANDAVMETFNLAVKRYKEDSAE